MKHEINERIKEINNGKLPIGYKRTRIGIIPEKWKPTRLEELITYKKGYAFKSKDYKDSGVRIIRISDTTYSSINNDNPVYISKEKKDLYREYELLENDLIITTVGSRPPLYDSMVGKVIKVNKAFEGSLLNQNTVRIRVRSNCNVNYLFNVLKTPRYIHFIETLVRGNANQVSITLKELFSFPLMIPPLKEQNQIANILSTWDNAIELQERLIEQKKEQKKGLMQLLLTGKKRLKGFSYNWKNITLDEAINKNYCKLIKGKDLKKYSGTKIYLSTSSIVYDKIVSNEGEITYYNRPSRAQLPGLYNSVWFAKMQSSIKVFRISKEDSNKYILSTGYFGFLPNEEYLNAEFLKQLFLSKQFNQRKDILSEGSSQSGIKNSHLKLIKIKIPPLQEQNAIAEVLSTADKEIKLLEQQLEQLKEQKKGLMQLLLTGIVRVTD